MYSAQTPTRNEENKYSKFLRSSNVRCLSYVAGAGSPNQPYYVNHDPDFPSIRGAPCALPLANP